MYKSKLYLLHLQQSVIHSHYFKTVKMRNNSKSNHTQNETEQQEITNSQTLQNQQGSTKKKAIESDTTHNTVTKRKVRKVQESPVTANEQVNEEKEVNIEQSLDKNATFLKNEQNKICDPKYTVNIGLKVNL